MPWQRRKERELRSHLDLDAEEQRETGVSAEDARYAAQRAFGNATLTMEQVRETWGWVAFEQMAGFALRLSRHVANLAIRSRWCWKLCAWSVLAVVVVLAAFAPTVWASRVDPMSALKDE